MRTHTALFPRQAGRYSTYLQFSFSIPLMSSIRTRYFKCKVPPESIYVVALFDVDDQKGYPYGVNGCTQGRLMVMPGTSMMRSCGSVSHSSANSLAETKYCRLPSVTSQSPISPCNVPCGVLMVMGQSSCIASMVRTFRWCLMYIIPLGRM